MIPEGSDHIHEDVIAGADNDPVKLACQGVVGLRVLKKRPVSAIGTMLH